MDETYRMLGREHQADLGREAARRVLAKEAARRPRKRFTLGVHLEAAAAAVGRVARRRVRAAPTT
jgi:hypothetical protein